MGQVLRGDEAGLVAWWSFDGGDARDGSPQGHDGQLLGRARCVAAPFPGLAAVRQPAVVAGVVRDETGVPLSDVRMHLRQGERVVGTGQTRQDGHYALAGLGSGAYTLVAELGEAHLQWGLTKPARLEGQPLPPQQVHLQEGMVLHRDLYAPGSQVAQWSGEGDARDGLGRHDGTLHGGAGFAPGIVGQAFALDGKDGWVRIPHDPELDLPGSFTLAAWVFPEVDNRVQSLIDKWPDDREETLQRRTYGLVIAPGLGFGLGITDEAHQPEAPFHDFQTPPNLVTLNTWNQVAAVYDQATGTRLIYVNGTEAARRQDPPITLSTNTLDLVLGGAQRTRDLPFKGLLDEVAIYHRALTEAAIQRLYRRQAEAHWAGEGNAADLRGGNQGTLVKRVDFAPGVVGQAFAFDGQGSYVELNPQIGNYGMADFSLELWLWREREGVAEPILDRAYTMGYLGEATPAFRYQTSSELDGHTSLYLDEAGRLQGIFSSGQDLHRLHSAQPLSLRTWHHLVLVRQGREMGLYVDGQPEATDTAARVVELALPMPLILGGAPAQDRYFQGMIDEVAFHNHALAPEGIARTYQTQLWAWRWRQGRDWLQRGGIGLAVVVGHWPLSPAGVGSRGKRLDLNCTDVHHSPGHQQHQHELAASDLRLHRRVDLDDLELRQPRRGSRRPGAGQRRYRTGAQQLLPRRWRRTGSEWAPQLGAQRPPRQPCLQRWLAEVRHQFRQSHGGAVGCRRQCRPQLRRGAHPDPGRDGAAGYRYGALPPLTKGRHLPDTRCSGQRVANGLYRYRLQAGDQVAVQKMLFAK